MGSILLSHVVPRVLPGEIRKCRIRRNPQATCRVRSKMFLKGRGGVLKNLYPPAVC